MRNDPEKIQRRRIRELAALAHERELARELGAVELEFSRWRRGEIDAHELREIIHTFHNGPSRRLYSVYNGDLLEMAVGAAIARGVLAEEEVPPEMIEVLRRHIDFAREMGTKEEASSEAPPNMALNSPVGRGRPPAGQRQGVGRTMEIYDPTDDILNFRAYRPPWKRVDKSLQPFHAVGHFLDGAPLQAVAYNATDELVLLFSPEGDYALFVAHSPSPDGPYGALVTAFENISAFDGGCLSIDPCDTFYKVLT
jgi:hypothetical protein